MNRTVKVTCFSLKPSIHQKLSDLFSRVGQVQKVYLSPDKNAGFLRFEYRSAVGFALDQEWSFSGETLKVRPVVSSERDDSPVRQVPNGPFTSDCAGTEWRPYCYSDYQTARNKLWFDLPHDYCATPCKKKKKKRKCGADLFHTSAPQAGKRVRKLQRKPKRKKKCAHLEMPASLPFGVTPSTGKETGTRQVFLKGQTTIPLSVPTTATAKDLLSLASEAMKVPSQYLHVTAESRVLTDELVQGIQDGSTLHATVKGLGGADSGEADKEARKKAEELKDTGNKMYQDKEYEVAIASYSASIRKFPLAAAYNNRAQCYLLLSQWEECILDCDQVLQREPENMKALLRRGKARKSKGDLKLAKSDLTTVRDSGPSSLSEQASSCLEEMESEKLAHDTETPPTEKPVQELSKSARRRLKKRTLKENSNNHQENSPEKTDTDTSKAEASATKKGSEESGQGPSQDTNCRKQEPDMGKATLDFQSPSADPDGKPMTPVSSAEAVRNWLQCICGLTQNHLDLLAGLDGEVLFDYKDNVNMLVDNTGIPVGVARKIIFLRDNPSIQSEMLTWDVDKVVKFIERFMEGQDISKIRENQIDGPAFLSYTAKEEIALDFKVKNLIAFQIFRHKQNFVSEEAKGDCHSEPDHGSPLLEPGETGDENSDPPDTPATTPCFTVTEEPSTRCVVLEEVDPFLQYKLYLQNELQLQPADTFSGTQNLTRCELRVLYHKRKDLNELEKQFMFLILCKPEFCKGKSAKDAFEKLWKLIKDSIPTKWARALPAESVKKYSFEGDRILLDGKALAFDSQPVKFSNIIEFETVRKLDECPRPTLIIDRELLVTGGVGYTLPLKLDKATSCPFDFGFLKDKEYWLFDSSDFGWGFERQILDTSLVGILSRFNYMRVTDICTPSGQILDAEETLSCPTTEDNGEQICEQVSQAPEDPQEDSASGVSASQTDGGVPEEESHADSSRLDPTEKEESSQPLKHVRPRPFKQQTWSYSPGLLRAIESGDMSRAVEFKFQAGCPPEQDAALRSFLYKSLEFVCACLNARKNGTIYFGIAERPVKEEFFKFGEIHGIEMDQNICQVYYDAFQSTFLEKCFPSSFECVKLCIAGPLFIPIRNTKKCVIEIDVEPEYEQTKQSMFYFDPRPIFKKYGDPAKSEKSATGAKEKHVYVKNQDSWTGIFRRDGSETKYLKESEKQVFEKTVLPEICRKRNQEDIAKVQAFKVDMNSQESEKLKQFISECDTSMFPILLLPKLSEREKQESIDFFEFLRYIRWTAVFDFDNDSDRSGIYSSAKSTNLNFEVHESVAKDFMDMSVEDRKDSISFPKKAVWLFTNGKSTGDNAFERLGSKEWKNTYWTYIQNAVAFYKANSVIPPQRRLVLILVAEEINDGIMEVSRDIKTAFSWRSVFFVFQCESVRQAFAEELSDDLYEHSVVMPWQHVHYLICQCLNLKSQDEDKYVHTSSGATVPIPFNEWQSWSDLDVLNVYECQKEWDGLTRDQRDIKAQEEEINFYQGKHVSWWNFFFTDLGYDHVMKRTPLFSNLISHIEGKIKNTDRHSDLIPIVTLSHMPGAGGTSLGKSLLWELKKKYKCAVVKSITLDTERQVTQLWKAVEGLDHTGLLPVILFADNLSHESSQLSEFDLCRRLYRRQLEMQLEMPFAILIHCHRTMKLEGRFCLPQKLSEEEEWWMEKKTSTLEKQHPEGVGTFIAFLAMRHGFDQAFLHDAISHYLDQKVLYENELKVIEFVSLITAYFPSSKGSPGLPVTSCDILMRNFKCEQANTSPWERTLSKIARVVLIVEYCYESCKNVVRIANQPYAKAVLETLLKQNSETLGDIVIRCLQSPLVSTALHSSKAVTEILVQMILERQFDEKSLGMTLMSPLIMDIKVTDCDKAIKVLQVGYTALKNEAIYQQLARLYMQINKLDDALKYAELAAELLPEKRDFKHTLGLVYLKKFDEVKVTFKNKGNMNISVPLEIANLALRNFIEAQGTMEDDALSICFAAAETIETVNKILQFLIDLIPVDKAYRLGRYLTEDDYCYNMFDSLQETEEQAMKRLLHTGIGALRFLFYLAYSNRLPQSDTSFQFSKYKRNMDNVIMLCRKRLGILGSCIGKLRLKTVSTSVYENRPQEDNSLRLRNVSLEGCFFESIFLLVGSLHSSRGERKREGIKHKLFEIKNNLESVYEKSYIDIDNLITIYLALEIAGTDNAFTNNKAKIYGFCNKIIRSGLEQTDTCYMRAHLYRVLVSWPQKYWEGFLEDEFKRSFRNKAPLLMHKTEQLLPKVHFYVTRESECSDFYLCHWTEIYEDTENELPPLHVMSQRLKTFTGDYKIKKNRKGEQFSSIEMKWKCAVGELSLTVWKIRGEKVFREECVEFYLGFSLHGPVAVIHRVLAD